MSDRTLGFMVMAMIFMMGVAAGSWVQKNERRHSCVDVSTP